MSCEDFIDLLGKINELKGSIEKLAPLLRENAITGRVLLYCELNELKTVTQSSQSIRIQFFNNYFRFQVLNLNFGNWEIFKLLILSLRDIENTAKTAIPVVKTDVVNDGASGSQPQPPMGRKKSVIEKQVELSFNFLTFISFNL